MVQSDPQDGPWKFVLRTYFQEAIEFFFPNTAKLIDWQHPPEFLDYQVSRHLPVATIRRRGAH